MNGDVKPVVAGGALTRWRVALAGTLLQVCLGTVYAWSYFQKPVVGAFGCSQSGAAWAFSLAIGFLGLAAAWGGLNLKRFGPTRLAVCGAVLYSAGYAVAMVAIAAKSLALFYLGFGVIGGIGLGLGYVTPVATVAKWFPDKKGLATGMVVMGFGFGALVMSKWFAPLLMGYFEGRLAGVFGAMGVILLGLSLPAAWQLRMPASESSGAAPSSWPSPPRGEKGSAPVKEIVMERSFVTLWVMFFCNIAAGIMFIGFQSPMLQDLLAAQRPELNSAQLAAAGATLIGLSSLCNGLGRLLWGSASDRLGRVVAFRLILATQLVVFVGLLFVRGPVLFGVLVCYVLLCYGGGFGTMPSLVLDRYGAERMPLVYGAILTAWSAAGAVGPQLAALIKDHCGAQASFYTFVAAAGLLGVGLGASWAVDRQ